MKTKITFVNLYRVRPYVKVVDWPEFVIMVSRTHGICVAEKWSETIKPIPHLILTVKCVDNDETGKGWKLAIHPESPVEKIQDASIDIYSAYPARREVLSAADTAPPHPGAANFSPHVKICWEVSNGGVVRFQMATLPPREKSTQFMLSVTDDVADDGPTSCPTANDSDKKNPSARITLLDLPQEMLALILQHVSSSELVDRIPFVCWKFFMAAKVGSAWRTIKFQEMLLPCLADLRAICKFAHEACDRLSWVESDFWGAGADELMMEEKLAAMTTDTRWSNLKRLSLTGRTFGLSEEGALVIVALRTGNFSSLEALELFMLSGNKWVSWLILANCRLPRLKELRIMVWPSNAPPVLLMNVFTASGLGSFNRLEKLHVLYDHHSVCREEQSNFFLPVSRALAAGRLPKLEELKVSGGGVETAAILQESFVHNGVRRLAIEDVRKWHGDSYPAETICQSVWRVFRRFPNLEALLLGGFFQLNWNDAPATLLQQLRRLSFSFSAAATGQEMEVPISHMVNLEVVHFSLFYTNEYKDPRQSSFKQQAQLLLGLKKLRAIRMDVGIDLKAITRCLESSSSGTPSSTAQGPVRVVEIEFSHSLNAPAATRIARILSIFPNVVRVSIVCGNLERLSMALAFSIIADTRCAPKLVCLELYTFGHEIDAGFSIDATAQMAALMDNEGSAAINGNSCWKEDGWVVLEAKRWKFRRGLHSLVMKRRGHDHFKPELRPFDNTLFQVRAQDMVPYHADDDGWAVRAAPHANAGVDEDLVEDLSDNED